ncbi:MAG: hypothetical protein HN348_34520 [Proteobacteria bacterium]|nr:hypothetical protein [Pseudomonadota bacterium]
MERLVEMLTEPGFRARLAAVSALGNLGDARAEGPLNGIHQSEPDGRIRRTAYEALVKIRTGRTSEEGLASLRSRLDSITEENRELRQRIDKLEGGAD